MTRTFVEVHVLQTVPPSNVNRDDTGSPKTATYGGVTRARVSSQAWKRATRVAFQDLLDRGELGVRTTRIVEQVQERIAEIEPELTQRAPQLAAAVVASTGIKLEKKKRKKAGGITEEHEESKYLVFLSRQQIDLLARKAVEFSDDSKEGLKGFKGKDLLRHEHAVDIALFGRMVADDADLNVDASAQVAHALSVHEVDNEFDYFTAVDDIKRNAEDEDAGASMIDTVEFNSSTLYRYANVAVDQLMRNLGSLEATKRALEAFILAFVQSMPTGKQNTFANRTLPDLVLVTVRDTQPINLVGAFESPVQRTSEQSYVHGAARRLAAHLGDVAAAYGQVPNQAWVVALGEGSAGWHEGLEDAAQVIAASMPEIPAMVSEVVAERLESE